MAQKTGNGTMQSNECARNCWIAAGVIGLLVLVFASFIGETSVVGGLFLGLITAVLLGLFLVWALCRGSGSVADGRGDVMDRSATSQAAPVTTAMPLHSAAPAATTSAAPAAPAPAASPAPAPALAPEPAPAPVAVAAPAAQPAADPRRDSAKAEHDKRKRTAKAEKKALEAASKDAAKKKGKAKQHSTLSLAETAVEVSGKKSKAKADPGEKKAKPAKAAKATPAKPDDLKQIKGVGPKLEKLLHDNGVTQFAQVAAWSDAEIDRFADLIGSMGGRIRSDDWTQQAKTLAAGGTTEFASRVKKGDVY